MPAKRMLTLNTAQRDTLEQTVRSASKPYLRERVAALLKIADGQSLRAVAHRGLLRHRRHDTVAEWLNRYNAEGLSGLTIRPGRGRKPAFFPSAPDK